MRSVRLADGEYAELLLVRMVVHIKARDEIVLVRIQMAQSLARPIEFAQL